MFGDLKEHLQAQLARIRESGLYKAERVLTSPQGARVGVHGSERALNLCANNYLGLADHPEVVAAAREALDRWGYGLSSVRFICGTQQIHKELERAISQFLQTDDTILCSSCFDANGGLFEALLDSNDAVISDRLNHASIIDGIRLCKAQRYRYGNNDMAELRESLQSARGARFRLIATDGVFSMDGTVAKLPDICDLAEQHNAVVMVDDSHGIGVLGVRGRGTHEYHGVQGRVDIITGTLGKALGGASGGFASGRREIVEMLRQRSRPYLFSNTLAPPIVGASLKALELLTSSSRLRDRLAENTRLFRSGMMERGFAVRAGDHPIVPIMLGEARTAQRMSERLLEKGIYVIGFSYPVVPEGQARIRVQISAAHSRHDLEYAMDAFSDVKRELRV